MVVMVAVLADNGDRLTYDEPWPELTLSESASQSGCAHLRSGVKFWTLREVLLHEASCTCGMHSAEVNK